MPLALLVNPASAGGRTLKLLPRVEQALDARRVAFRVAADHAASSTASSRRCAAVEAGEIPVVMSGDGLIGAVGGAMAGSETPLGIIPGGRGNDLARVLGIPDDPEAAVEVARRRPHAAGSTSARPTASASSASSASASTPKPTGSPTRPSCHARQPRLRLRGAAHAARLEAGPLHDPGRRASAIRFTGYSVSVANSKAFGGGMFIAPDAELDDGEFDVVTVGEVGKLRFLGNLPKVFKGTHVEEDEVSVFRAPHLELSAEPAVPGLRRRRAPHRPARPRCACCRGRSACSCRRRPGLSRRRGGAAGRCSAPSVAAARAIGAASRASGRGGGTTLPGRVLLRLAPDAIARLGARLDRGTTIVSATNGKTTTAGMIAAVARAPTAARPVHNRAGSNMTWGVATALLEQRGREGLFEVDEAWLPRVADAARPVADRARQPLPRPARPLRRDGGAGRRVGEDGRRARPGAPRFVLNADDPLIADLGRDAEERPREGVVYFGIEDASQALPELQHAFDAKHCRRCGHPYAYERAFVGHLGHYSCPNCGAERPRPDVAATEIELRGMERLARRRCARPPGEMRARAAAARPLQRLQRARRGRRRRCELGVAPERIAAALAEMRGRLRPGRDDRGRRHAGLDPADQEPRRRQRGAAHPAARGRRARRSTSGSRSTTGSPTAATSPGSGTPTSSCSRAPCGASSAPAPGRRRWRCGSSTRAGRRTRSRSSRRSRPRSTAPSPRRPGRLFALPTYTALLELRKLLADRGLAKEFWR